MVRILAPTGAIGTVPAESLQDALDAGAKVLSPDEMRQLRQATFMEHQVFKEKHTRPTQRKRRSIVRGGKR